MVLSQIQASSFSLFWETLFLGKFRHHLTLVVSSLTILDHRDPQRAHYCSIMDMGVSKVTVHRMSLLAPNWDHISLLITGLVKRLPKFIICSMLRWR